MIGYIGISSNKKNWISKLIRFFTKSEFSHTFIITDNIYNIITVQEASHVVQLVPFEKYYKFNDEEYYVLFKIRDDIITEEELKEAIEKCHNEFSGVKYGYFQLLWFVYRRINELFGIDVRKNKNWLADGVICSELVYYYLEYLGFGHLLKDFNADTIQAQDILNILKFNNDIFEMVEYKWLT